MFLVCIKDIKPHPGPLRGRGRYNIVIISLTIVFIMFCCANTAYAQSLGDTVRSKGTLKEATIKDARKKNGDTKAGEFAPGQKITTIDTTTLQQYKMESIATLLTQQVPVFVKSYGFNGLATLSFRGASAAQSAVYWGGVPIQNAALGIADVSTLPVMFMDNVQLIYGGSSALYGSGNVGGALLLDDNMAAGHSLWVNASTGSFGQYAGGIDVHAQWKKWRFSVKGLLQVADNDFSYTDNTGKEVKTTNSHLQGKAAMANAAYTIANAGVLGFSAWVQQYDREVPPALFEMHSDKKQVDGSVRLRAKWNSMVSKKNRWDITSSFTKDDIHYTDNAILLNTSGTVYQYFQEVRWTRALNKYGSVTLFTPLQVAWMNAPVTNLLKQQNKAALAGAYDIKLLHNRLNIAVNVRAESVDSVGFASNLSKAFLLPGADAAYRLTNWLTIRANVQKTYRVPTLNELYYYPGGNSTLKPEQGWNEDGGYAVNFTYNKWTVHHDVSVFNREIHDWIIWLGGAIWTPHNIAEVHSRGAETENRIAYTTGKWKLHLGLNTAYVLSTTVSSYLYNDGSIGKQIPYTPRYNGQLNIGFTYNRLYLNYNHTYTGYRYTVADESVYLPPYQTGNVQAMYSTNIKKHPLQLTTQCNNIWGVHYTVVASRPLPGVNFLCGVRVGVL